MKRKMGSKSLFDAGFFHGNCVKKMLAITSALWYNAAVGIEKLDRVGLPTLFRALLSNVRLSTNYDSADA